MLFDEPMLAMTKKEWHTFNKYNTVILTDIVPPEVVKDYNEHVVFWRLYGYPDYVVHPKDFYAMRKRIKYADEKIFEEMKIIYNEEEITKFLKELAKEN